MSVIAIFHQMTHRVMPGCDNHRGEYGDPWEIDDEMPAAERTALWEQTRKVHSISRW